MSTVAALIERHGLARHPEGGWYREMHRSPITLPHAALPHGYSSDRVAVTSILYLLPAGERSRRHRVRSEELWLHQAGDPLRLKRVSPDGATRDEVLLGAVADAALQAVVPAGWWQSAEPVVGEHGYVLVGCVVAPGFDFDDFEIADAQDEA